MTVATRDYFTQSGPSRLTLFQSDLTYCRLIGNTQLGPAFLSYQRLIGNTQLGPAFLSYHRLTGNTQSPTFLAYRRFTGNTRPGLPGLPQAYRQHTQL